MFPFDLDIFCPSLSRISTLALGVGANTAIFSVVRGILLRPLPFSEPDRLVVLESDYGGQISPYSSPTNIADWRDQNRSFTSMATIGGDNLVLTGVGDPERLRGFDVSGDFFAMLGVPAIHGRNTFTADETTFRGPKAAIISDVLWHTRFGSDTTVVGRTITLDNEPYRVVGIVPSASAWPANTLIWYPFTYDPAQLPHSRGAVFLTALARLKPGTTLDAAGADMRGIAKRLEAQYPNDNAHLSTRLLPLHEYITGELRRPLLVLLGGVGFVLLIACANVANLTLVRGIARTGELAVRTALGAPRGRLVRQLVTESVVLSLIGGTAGLMVAIVGTRLLVSAAPSTIPRLSSVHVDGVVLAFALGVSLLTGLFFGLFPARQLLRPGLTNTLREGGRGVIAQRGSNRLRRALVVTEVALSVMLLAGAGLLIRSFERLTHVDPGFRTDHSITFGISLPNARYRPDQQRIFVSSLSDRLTQIPGVQSAGIALGLPLTPFGFDFTFSIAGKPPRAPGDEPSAEVRVATPTYLATMGIPVLQGRGFSDADRSSNATVLLITSAAAKQFFPGEDPIGKHVKFGWGDLHGGQLEGDIVGVVGDVKPSSLAQAALPQFYVPYDQRPVASFSVVLHTTRDPQLVVADARRAVAEMDKDLAVSQIKLLDQIVSDSVAQPRFYMMLLVVFAAVAVALAAIGIYGVVAYLVGQRSREIGIRIALGASTRRVVELVLREGIVMAAVGLAVGLGGAVALTRVMTSLLFDIKPTDPPTYMIVAASFGVVALAASCVPALRAAKVDPALAMRAE